MCTHREIAAARCWAACSMHASRGTAPHWLALGLMWNLGAGDGQNLGIESDACRGHLKAWHEMPPLHGHRRLKRRQHSTSRLPPAVAITEPSVTQLGLSPPTISTLIPHRGVRSFVGSDGGAAGRPTSAPGPTMLRAAASSLLGNVAWTASTRQLAPTAAWAALSGRPLMAQPAPADTPEHHSSFGHGSSEEELAEFREGVRTFAKEVVAPHAAEIDRLNAYPPRFEFWRAAGEMGLHGAPRAGLACTCSK